MTDSKSSNSNFLAIGILLLVGSFGYLYRWQVPALQEAEQKYAQASAERKAKEAQVNALSQAQTSLTEKESILQEKSISRATLLSVLPTTEDMPNLYIQMENLMKSGKGIINPSYQLGRPLESEGSVQIPITITATGSYADLKEYLKQLENNIRPVTFTILGFQLGTTTPDGKAYYTLSATGYIRAQGISPAYTSTTPLK